MNPKRISKALAATIAALVGAYATAQSDGAITNAEWFAIAGAAILAGITTYLAPKNAEVTE